MSDKELEFVIPQYDVSNEKKYIVSKITQGKYLNNHPNPTDYAVLNGLKTHIAPDNTIHGEYWLANAVEVYESPRERDDRPDFYMQATSDCRTYPSDNKIGIKPVTDYFKIKDFCKVKDVYIYPKYFEQDEEYLFVEFGQYPQTIVDKNLNEILEKLYRNNQLVETGMCFSRNISRNATNIDCISEKEYEFNGEKYVRALNLNQEGILSNAQKAGKKEYYWVKVEPVIWFIDKTDKTTITDKIIIGGVAYNDHITYSYEETLASKFINDYFAKDLLNSCQEISKKNPVKKTHKVKVKRIK